MFASPDLPSSITAAFAGKPIATPEETPVVYHRTKRGYWKRILEMGLIAGGTEEQNTGKAHVYLSDKTVEDSQ